MSQSHRRFVRFLAWSAALIAPIAVSGCGDPDAPEIARVTGTVTRGGKPIPNLTVNFVPDEGRASWGITDDQGKYELEYNEDYKGAKVDHHMVYVIFNAGSIEGAISGQADGQGISAEDRQQIMQKYGNMDTTQLEVDVTEDPQVIDLKLD
ncbi:Ig-like domain-containing protein [Tautonia plasticadhaerens]|uniref:Carboxypeptidase regulatory-like domain-containing protein n=1 Tax=Tautonia plasticadhaerens TaxID=2527974 RepID=A0A518HDK5_9BACT|nr:hypothetical protein [Tautonia plasticadhaerens]QDV38939.1 hypothetical protein ElP_68990 [Tautonia plasticadhaerens]